MKLTPRTWNNKIDKYLLDHGFTKGLSEPSLYVKMQGDHFLILCLYVDDLIYIDFNKAIMKKYEMIDLGLMRYCLGMQVKQKPK